MVYQGFTDIARGFLHFLLPKGTALAISQSEDKRNVERTPGEVGAILSHTRE